LNEKTNEKKRQALDLAISQIDKEFGKGSIMWMGSGALIDGIETISTGALSLDIALGIGGIPRGRVIEIYGNEASGKTTLSLHIAAEAQKKGGVVGFIDAEHALDPQYARKLGVDTDEILISQPDSGEEALEIAEILVRSGALDLVIVDSVAALVPKSELEGDMGDSQMGVQARLMSQAMRKLTGVVSKSKTTLLFINQVRMKIGAMMFGNPETTTGGRALKFYASIRLDVRRIASITVGQEIVGSRTKVKIVKNKLAPPFKTAEFDLMFGEGISQQSCILDLALDKGLIDKSGSWFSYQQERLGQGRENVKNFLKDNPKITSEIEQKIRELAGLPSPPSPAKK